MKICLIGNSGSISNDLGGQTIKLRLYKKKIEDEGFDLFFVDLERFYLRPLYILAKIKEGIRISDRIVLISGERACLLLIPYINRINKKYGKPFVLPVVGSGMLHYSINHLDDKDKYNFFVSKNYSLAKKKYRVQKSLEKITYVLPETELTKQIYQEFYNLNNVKVLTNFRETDEIVGQNNNHNNPFKIVYISRIIDIKGIFDLLEVASHLKQLFTIDIYGTKYLSRKEDEIFASYLNKSIRYLGEIDNDKAINTLTQFDLLVFPTKAPYECVPGILAESLIASTPVLASNFPQARYILKNRYDSILYHMYDINDFYKKLSWCIDNQDIINNMRKNALESGKKFTYTFNRKLFLKYICGVEI